MAPVLCDWRMYDDEGELHESADDEEINKEINTLIDCNKDDFCYGTLHDKVVQVEAV